MRRSVVAILTVTAIGLLGAIQGFLERGLQGRHVRSHGGHRPQGSRGC